MAPLGNMPDTYGHAVDAERARATVREVFASPVNFLDTSRNYGFGRSEERVWPRAHAHPRYVYQDATRGMLKPIRKIEQLCARFGVPPGAAALPTYRPR